MSFNPFALIELWVALAFGAAWLILEWQGRRLDRARERREADARHGDATHAAQESNNSHDQGPPAG